jgi:hypothetical protein
MFSVAGVGKNVLCVASHCCCLMFTIHWLQKMAKLGMQQFRRLSADRLNAMPKEIQRLSKTRVPGSAEPFSLDTLRAQLNSR